MPSLTLQPEQSQSRWGFIVALSNSAEGAEAHYDRGLEMMAFGDLRPSHQRAWEELWADSLVELTGPDTLSRALIGCMFYLISAFPYLHEASNFGGVSPGGLSNGGEGQDYWGHVFWDQVRLVSTVNLKERLLFLQRCGANGYHCIYSIPLSPLCRTHGCIPVLLSSTLSSPGLCWSTG